MFDLIIDRAKEAGADVTLATDPDCDRIGCAAPLTFKKDAPWHTLHGQPDLRAVGRLRAGEPQGGGPAVAEAFHRETLVTTQLVPPDWR